MEEVVDGEYQAYKAKDGAYVRQHFFGKYPELLAMVAHLSDDEIYALNRGVKLFNIFFGYWDIKTLGKFCNLLKAQFFL
jgi:pyruvate dehydrogenase complex dehydrogenase (E1) component